MRANRRVWLFVLATFGALAGAAGAHATTVQFTTPCTPTSFVVPAGVFSVSISAQGAQGGQGSGVHFGGLGGLGSRTISVTPGESLQVIVGGVGGTGGLAGGAGGCNGGGNGGGGGAGGGGASDVRQGGTALANRVVIGGGGGGSAAFGDGGTGGGTSGGTSNGFLGGGAGTQNGPGLGAQFGGGDGSLGSGGAGATGGLGTGGGGGGGGLFGGGGGGTNGMSGGGGGGGSGFAPAGGTLTNGVRSGDGLVQITYTVVAARLRSFGAGRSQAGVVVRWRTATEVDTLGFNVFRSVGNHRVRLNARLIAAHGPGRYSYADRRAPASRPLVYWLQAVDGAGARTWYGPARVT
jgi:hypothetical protein